MQKSDNLFKPLSRSAATEALFKLGFKKNDLTFCDYRPHFKKGQSVVFLLSFAYWEGTMESIGRAFENSGFTVYGVLLDDYPHDAGFDWVNIKNLSLLDPVQAKVCPAALGNEYMITEYREYEI